VLKNYLKTALRNLMAYKGYSLINILGLSVGMACFILIFLWVQDELSYDHFHENAHELYRVVQEDYDHLNDSERATTSAPFALAALLKEEFPEVKETARVYSLGNFLLRYGDRSFYEDEFALVDPSFFKMFTFEFVKGDPQKNLEGLHSVIITEDAAKKYFGDEDPMGKILNMNNRFDITVAGVIKNIPGNSHFQFDFIARIDYLGKRRLESWEWASETYVLLEKNTSLSEFSRKAADTIVRHNPITNYKVHFQPLDEIHLYHPLGERGQIIMVYIFALVAVFILVIACLNFMNLATARSIKRSKEVGLRKVVGASKVDIIKQFLGESIQLAVIAVIIAVFLTELFLPFFNRLTAKQLDVNILENVGSLLLLLALAVLTGVLSGSYPAFFLSAFQPVKVLREQFKRGPKSSWFRITLVVIQFAISIILIISTVVVYNQINYIRNLDLGFDRTNLIYMNARGDLRTKYEAVKSELLRHPDILKVAYASSLPVNITNVIDVDWDGKNPDIEDDMMGFAMVDYDYIKTLDLKIVQGRDFSMEFPTDRTSYIVNEEAVSAMELESPLGKKISLGKQFPDFGPEGPIIGVIKNFHFGHMQSRITPLVLGMNPQWNRQVFIKIRPKDIPSIVNHIQAVSKKFAPNYPFVYGFIDDAFDEMYRSEQRVGESFRYFALLAIVISCLGLFGLASFMAEQKTKEIGIRKVHGASVPNILFFLSRQFLRGVVVANIIAWPAAYFVMSKWLDDFVYRINFSIWIFVFAAVTALAIAFLTVSYQAARAALSNPIDALRYE